MQKPRSTSEALFWLSLVFLLCISIGMAATSLLWPLSWDEGIFAWIGGILAHGGTPYVDAWDVKGPIAYFGYALANTLLGSSAHAVRILDLLLTIVGTACVHRLLQPLVGHRAAWIAALLLFVSVLGQGYNVNGQPDLWAGWCLVFTVSLMTVPASAMRVTFGAMLLGIAVLIKPTYAAMGLLLVIPIVYSEGRNWKAYPRFVLAIIVGGTIPLACCAAWFWSRGALQEFWDAYISFNVESGASNAHTLSGVAVPMVGFLGNHRAIMAAIPAICFGLLAHFKPSATSIPVWKTRLLATWIVTLLALVILQNRWFTYHWAPMFPPLAIAAAIGFHRLLAWQRNGESVRMARWIAITGVALITAGASLSPIRQISRAFQLVTHRMTTDDFLLAFNDYPGEFTARDVKLASQYIKKNTLPSDFVFVWEDPNVNVLSGRRTPGRFAFWTPLISAGAAMTSTRYEANRAEFFHALERRRPALLLMERAAWRGGNERTIANVPMKFPAFVLWVDANYVEADSAGNFLVFRPR
ncbi:MAG: glycosyltransferase family 39 protein [Gemmatimonas sp.]